MDNFDISQTFERIKNEKNKLLRIYKNIDPTQKKVVEKLIDNAAFMAITLENLQYIININCYGDLDNPSAVLSFNKIPEINLYNGLIKNYHAVIKQLTFMLRKAGEIEDTEADELDDFIQE